MNALLWYVFAGTRGGETRLRIIHAILTKPCNAHKLASALKLDYKTIQHHLDVLTDNRLLVKKGSYGAVFLISPELEAHLHVFNEIWERLGKDSGKRLNKRQLSKKHGT